MEIQRICAAYFSATGTTERVVKSIAEELAKALKVPYRTFDFTLPEARVEPPRFEMGELVVFGTPVYAGRVPNVLLQYLQTIEGNGAPAIPVVVYGNRDYDDALIELRDLLVKGGFYPFAAAAFVGEHSFSEILAKGRPDQADLEKTAEFAMQAAKRCREIADVKSIKPIIVEGTPYPYRGYYQPRDRKGVSIDIRKVKPLTKETCDDCKICVHVCPMGSIDQENVRVLSGICIKCGACIKKCPRQAKYYDDAGYLYHQHELEEGLTRRAEPELFL